MGLLALAVVRQYQVSRNRLWSSAANPLFHVKHLGPKREAPTMYEPNTDDISAVIMAADIQDVKNECDLLVNDANFPIKISAFDLFCQKTGHKIGTRDQASLFALIKICGKDVSSNIYNCTTFNVHPAWLYTDPDSLDSLMDSDPVGYAVYALAIVTAQFYQTRKNQNPKLYPSSDRLWALARANALLSQQGVGQITELNIELARMITFMPNSTNHFFNAIRKFGCTPDALAMLHCTGTLIERIHTAVNNTLNNISATNHHVRRTKAIDDYFAATPEDAARGPTNVRKQRVSQKKLAEAALMSELEKLFNDTGLTQSLQASNLPGSTAWREKMAAQRTARENKDAEIARELAALAEISNLALPESDDSGDDNDVEVRFLYTEEPNGEAVANDIRLNDISLENVNKLSPEQRIEATTLVQAGLTPQNALNVVIDTTPIKDAIMGQMKNRPELFKEISPQEHARKLEQEKSGQPKLSALQMLRAKKEGK